MITSIENITETSLPTINRADATPNEIVKQPGALEVTRCGRLVITNTGGSSASEGGMGSGSDDDREKGSLSQPGEKSGSSLSTDDSDLTFDPIKKSVKEAEKENKKD